MKIRSFATTLTALSAAAALSACGATSTAQAHDQADVTFVQQMIPHHSQAVEMSKLAADHAGSAQVKDLAARIEAAQQPEIDQMNGYLRTWGASTPASGEHSMAGMDHGGMPGMMTTDEMGGLEQARGATFDTTFLRMMIAHHQGAVAMSGTELRDGQSTDAKALAQKIIDAQQREITEMQGLSAK